MPNSKTKKKMPCRSCKPSPKNKLFNDEIYQSRVKSSEYKDIKRISRNILRILFPTNNVFDFKARLIYFLPYLNFISSIREYDS